MNFWTIWLIQSLIWTTLSKVQPPHCSPSPSYPALFTSWNFFLGSVLVCIFSWPQSDRQRSLGVVCFWNQLKFLLYRQINWGKKGDWAGKHAACLWGWSQASTPPCPLVLLWNKNQTHLRGSDSPGQTVLGSSWPCVWHCSLPCHHRGQRTCRILLVGTKF